MQFFFVLLYHARTFFKENWQIFSFVYYLFSVKFPVIPKPIDGLYSPMSMNTNISVK